MDTTEHSIYKVLLVGEAVTLWIGSIAAPNSGRFLPTRPISLTAAAAAEGSCLQTSKPTAIGMSLKMQIDEDL